jgi:sec-independent protein translocase protein TatA
MDFFLAFWQFGPFEIALVGIAALILFGKRLPDVARSLGKGITEFKKGIKDVEDEVEKPLKDSEPEPEDEPDSEPEGENEESKDSEG